MSLSAQTEVSIEVPQVAWTYLLSFTDRPVVLASERVGSQEMTFPGGKVERGELPVKAARRELEEETGIYLPDGLPTPAGRPQVIEFLGRKFRAHTFVISLKEFQHTVGYPHLEEPGKHIHWEWISLEELPDLVAQQRLPRIAIEGGWLVRATEAYGRQCSPTHLFDECRQWRRLARQQRIAELIQ